MCILVSLTLSPREFKNKLLNRLVVSTLKIKWWWLEGIMDSQSHALLIGCPLADKIDLDGMSRFFSLEMLIT